ncbi:hypothetical protein [Pseudomonas sp. BMS12]|uniref:hypothetical protein n=1 Tax=Pseudomonas sp. BMS12 TaxID=1796033 RepID=UPI00083A3795|nr:hypothetical protein [Pseudomonas sp. BMS12]
MTKALSTRDLLRGEHHLHLVGHKPGRRWVWLVLLLLASIGLAAYLRLQQEAGLQGQLSQLTRENTELKASLAQLRMQQREAEAAQAQLVRRNGDLAAQVKKLKTDLTFFRQQQDR